MLGCNEWWLTIYTPESGNFIQKYTFDTSWVIMALWLLAPNKYGIQNLVFGVNSKWLYYFNPSTPDILPVKLFDYSTDNNWIWSIEIPSTKH